MHAAGRADECGFGGLQLIQQTSREPVGPGRICGVFADSRGAVCVTAVPRDVPREGRIPAPDLMSTHGNATVIEVMRT